MCGLIPRGSWATTIRDMTGELLHPRQLSTKRSHVANILYPSRIEPSTEAQICRSDTSEPSGKPPGPVSNRNDIRKPSGTLPGMRCTIRRSADTPKHGK